jgi:hypothetical protein
MANTYIQIGSTVTVGSGGAASIDFTSIPGTYTDLLLKVSTRSDLANAFSASSLSFNSNTANYSWRELFGVGNSQGSNNGSDITKGSAQVTGASATASTFSNIEIYIPNYASANYKSFSVDGVTENNATSAAAVLYAYLWSNVAAITSIALTANTGNYVQYSTATLYGISKS